ncbi:MAG: CPBP family intramembrane metalloprotease, partial [Chloroflexota bacterium]|nr:CPBP family intramembrane metalloprotease [Chloroflexota bacterium]
MAVGISAFLTEVGVAYASGWVSFPDWGWASTSKAQVASSLLILAAHHANVAWFEEMIFRGYGLDVATAGFRQPAAVVGLSVLFALAHGPGWLQF